MNKHIDDQWKLLQQLEPPKSQKDMLRTRVWKSIQAQPAQAHGRLFQWKSITAATILLMICGSFLGLILQESTQQRTTYEEPLDLEQFSWKLTDVYPKKSGEGGILLYRKDDPVEVGTVKEVTEEEKNEMVNRFPMYVEETIEKFPYPMTMYIEHVKMMEVALRYHFFIAYTDENWIHITFDYPKLEYAEIFNAMSTLELKGKKPYIHDEQLYVKHGYGDLIYPVGLEPVAISGEKEVYHWPNATTKVYSDYLGEIINGPGNWQQRSVDGLTRTFVHKTFKTELSITLDGEEITYEFVYHNQDD
ncbi:hypothetical protein [Cytobacillus pseudoceanisediminis]|uniref:hypothetical protein n=1 Tax=Cytobacillus pseudoceanisediminis TaxID=3051614 RepID=UPI003C2DAEDF